MSAYRILTLNIHKGFSIGNRQFTLETIRQCLRESQANVVFLQEVVGENIKFRQRIKGWPQANQLEYLADSVWDHFAYGKNAIYQHGHHGNAILSESPFREWKNIDISCYSFSQRGFLHGTTQDNQHLLCVHMGLLEKERRIQTRQLIDYIENCIPRQEAIILAGDFNDWRSSVHRELERKTDLIEVHQRSCGKLASTYPARLPLLKMDRIYVRGFEILGSHTLTGKDWAKMSDHCALVGELQFA